MTPAKKVAQLLAVARSTTYPAERETALDLARRLHNKHRLMDPRLRWELLTEVGQEAGPEPPRPAPAVPEPAWPFSAPAATDPFMWTSEDMSWLRALWEEARRAERPRSRRSSGKRQKRVLRVRPHDGWRYGWYTIISGYTREVRTHQITFTCRRCGERVTQQRWPGPAPVYCSEGCRREAVREQTRERVRRHRAARRAARCEQSKR